jgi:hypothetical protein
MKLRVTSKLLSPAGVSLINTSPPNRWLKERLATAYMMQGDHGSSIDLYRELVHEHPCDHGLQGRLQDAIKRNAVTFIEPDTQPTDQAEHDKLDFTPVEDGPSSSYSFHHPTESSERTGRPTHHGKGGQQR